MLLDDLEIARCEECGKLFQREPGRRLCSECAPPPLVKSAPVRRMLEPVERELVHDLARSTGLSKKAIEESIRLSPGRGSVLQGGPVCVRCRMRPPMDDNDFCVYCQLDLYRTLGDAANDLFNRMEILEPEPEGPASVISAYEEKRRRTATSHINPSGARWLKKYTNI